MMATTTTTPVLLNDFRAKFGILPPSEGPCRTPETIGWDLDAACRLSSWNPYDFIYSTSVGRLPVSPEFAHDMDQLYDLSLAKILTLVLIAEQTEKLMEDPIDLLVTDPGGAFKVCVVQNDKLRLAKWFYRSSSEVCK